MKIVIALGGNALGLDPNKQKENVNLKQGVKIMSGLVINSCVMLLLQSIINFVLSLDSKGE